MKIHRIITILFLLSVLASCSARHKYWDVSKFTIKAGVLKDNEKIKLLYVGPSTNDKDYYTHLIVVSQATGDTVNVLTFCDNGFNVEDKDKTFPFYDENNDISKIATIDPTSLPTTNVKEAIDKIIIMKRHKVLRDPNFDHFASNNFPSVIGIIGTVTEP